MDAFLKENSKTNLRKIEIEEKRISKIEESSNRLETSERFVRRAGSELKGIGEYILSENNEAVHKELNKHIANNV